MTNIWTPHNYQLTALSFLLSNPHSGLFLDPGLGKTSISLAAIKILINSGKSKGILMIAPLRVSYSVWPNEITKWKNFNKLTHAILHSDGKFDLWKEKKDIYIINPEGLEWLHKELLRGLKKGKKCPFDSLWIDESTKFSAYDSNRLQYIVDMIPLFKRRHIMTGTPTSKLMLDLWSQIYILDQGKALGETFYQYRNKYFHTTKWNKYKWELNDFAEPQIHDKIAPLVLEMSASDHLDIPPLIHNPIVVTLPEDARKIYNDMEKIMFAEINADDDITADAAAQVSMKCHQIANGRVYEDIPEDLDDDAKREFKKTRKTFKIHNAKAEALKDLIEELNGKPLLVAYFFRHDLQAINDALGYKVPYIGSGVSEKECQRLEKEWNKGNIPVLCGHPMSMGYGLNLQESGNDICWYSMTWSLSDTIQFIKRVWRQGVQGKCRNHMIIAEKTVDELIVKSHEERDKVQISMREAIRHYRKERLHI